MAGKGPGNVLVGYTKMLVTTVLFPLLWLKAWSLAGKHAEADPKGRMKVAAAIVISIAIGIGGAGALIGFNDAAGDGVYDTLDSRLQVRTLEQEYQDQGTIIFAKNGQIPTVQKNIIDRNTRVESNLDRIFQDGANKDAFVTAWTKFQGQATAVIEQGQAGQKLETDGYTTQAEKLLALWATALEDEEEALQLELGGVVKEATDLPLTRAVAEKELFDAQSRRNALEGHHELYNNVAPYIAARDDAEVYARLNSFNAAHAGSQDLVDMDAVDHVFAIKDDALADMNQFMNWLMWPSLVGSFFAPLAFALGSIMKKAWVPSDSVGYKVYPGAAAGYFLLFGAFGVPALPFAAWTFFDIEVRSIDGQISL